MLLVWYQDGGGRDQRSMDSAPNGVWNVLSDFPYPDVVASTRKHVHNQDNVVRFLVCADSYDTVVLEIK